MKERTVRGFFWLVLDSGGSQAFSFAIFMVLVRFVSPEEYGVFALAGSIISFVFLLFQGMSAALLHREHLEESHQSTAFWCALLVGAAVWLILRLAAPSLAVAFHMPSLVAVLVWMSPIALLMAAATIPFALLRRKLELSAFAARTVMAYAVGGTVSIGLALRGWGVLALAIGQLVQWAVATIVVFSASRWRPSLQFSGAAAAEMASFALKSTSAMAVQSVSLKLDVLIVAAFLDPHSVGCYAVAVRLLQTIATVVLQPALMLVMPVLSRLRREPEQFDRAYQSLVRAANSLWLPLVAAMGVVAPQVVPLAFGVKWTGSIAIVQAMCLAAFTDALNVFAGQALSAQGQLAPYNALMVVQTLITAALFTIAAHFGPVAVGLAWAGTSLFTVPVAAWVMHRYAGVDVIRVLRDGLRVATCGAAMVVTMLLIERLVGRMPAGWALLCELSGAAAVYLVLLELVALPGYVTRMARLARTALPMVGVAPERLS